MSRTDDTQMSMKGSDKVTHLVIPTPWFKWIIGIGLGALFGAWTGGLPSFLPKRGEAKAEAAVFRSDADNHRIIESLTRIEALNSDLATLNSTVVSLRQTVAELREDVRTLNARVDGLYGHPRGGIEWIPNAPGTALVPKPGG